VDITERKRAEQALQKSEELFRQIAVKAAKLLHLTPPTFYSSREIRFELTGSTLRMNSFLTCTKN